MHIYNIFRIFFSSSTKKKNHKKVMGGRGGITIEKNTENGLSWIESGFVVNFFASLRASRSEDRNYRGVHLTRAASFHYVGMRLFFLCPSSIGNCLYYISLFEASFFVTLLLLEDVLLFLVYSDLIITRFVQSLLFLT